MYIAQGLGKIFGVRGLRLQGKRELRRGIQAFGGRYGPLSIDNEALY